ncbi:hypothetical protein E3N88_12936 [Mikania micrantha]|uniref:Phytocyanin domain-containing protein n=1 Tax=Mikania micrantha TaxID=192012 RepID=A0A5N6P9F5_9ASTR|nr:hypothetical protein E3N88_12936 [Mikania micrantha]
MASPALLFLTILVITCFASRCLATTYTVGDSSGWDISTDVDSWARDKRFVVVFQYSSSHSVAEVNRASYQGCNTTNVLHPSSNGNTTFALTKPGDRYFVCGNRLHCYAGMKLHVVVDGKMADGPVAGGPEAEPGGDSSATPTTTTNTSPSKNNNPSSFVPSSVGAVTIGFKSFVFMGFTCLTDNFRRLSFTPKIKTRTSEVYPLTKTVADYFLSTKGTDTRHAGLIKYKKIIPIVRQHLTSLPQH